METWKETRNIGHVLMEAWVETYIVCSKGSMSGDLEK